MGDRCFPNSMPDFVPETAAAVESILSMPYPIISERLKRAALDLKEAIVLETWGVTGQRVRDFTLYSGALGTAFLLLKAHEVTANRIDLSLCAQIVKACDQASSMSTDVTFICGRAGVCAIGAVAARRAGDEQLLCYYLGQFNEIKLPRNLPDELLYGKVGFLWACLFLNKHIGEGTVASVHTRAIVEEIIQRGRALAKGGASPLMFEWYGERYWGGAHGLAGILHILMDMELKPDEIQDVKGTIRYMIRNRFPNGNYPSSEEDRGRDILVHWCHGAPGVALTLVKAAKVFGEEEFVQAAADAGEVVWRRGLLKRVGICHGVSGNSYVFLSLYQLTGKVEYLYKAKAFACFLLDRAHRLIAEGEMHGGDSRYSLFEGVGGMAYLFLDMIEPSMAKFPGYDL
ncbi:lanC-like protein GCL2 isoform X1 [Cucurbita maxima]|uniref:LanC-like protein GCL2 isoform X1 n=1 Tax=Cucurbita maxima TaxID=3661 RepID=A0A6J1JCS6_CUCMA|nr:lanC-like protein GCL2 isoform X1 [Cucurbita maxima]XP_022985979.1 lanC-like protein GCL2 isoform X1 [Cucurbita maxima]XP_022985980.1 lanC-like protein GCL2 isoform X1 [Cucurbita maxima]